MLDDLSRINNSKECGNSDKLSKMQFYIMTRMLEQHTGTLHLNISIRENEDTLYVMREYHGSWTKC